jgi:hypothetical protein
MECDGMGELVWACAESFNFVGTKKSLAMIRGRAVLVSFRDAFKRNEKRFHRMEDGKWNLPAV